MTHLFAPAILMGVLMQLPTGSVPRPGSITQTPPQSAHQPRLSQAAAHVGSAHAPRQLAPAAVTALLAAARRTSDASQAGELFAAKSWYVPPPPPPPAPPPVAAAPVAPSLPYAFVGSYTDGNDVTVYFLTRDDRVYDVKPGDTLDQIYSVDAVENGQLVFTYKPLKVRQLLSIGAGP